MANVEIKANQNGPLIIAGMAHLCGRRWQGTNHTHLGRPLPSAGVDNLLINLSVMVRTEKSGLRPPRLCYTSMSSWAYLANCCCQALRQV